MANHFKPCPISGCNRNASAYSGGARGWCATHYTRWRKYGDPLAVKKTANGTIPKWIHEVAAHHRSDECLIWPFSKDTRGYGRVGKGYGEQLAHRLVCDMTRGPAPTAKYETAHKCGNPSCVNPLHLRWKTHKENEQDKIHHGTDQRGTRNKQARRNEADIREIRRLYASGVLQKDIALRFGTTQGAISSIICGRRWAWLE